jgi:phage protein U
MPVIKTLEYHEITSTTGWWDEEEADSEAFHEQRVGASETEYEISGCSTPRVVGGWIFLLIRENSAPRTPALALVSALPSQAPMTVKFASALLLLNKRFALN